MNPSVLVDLIRSLLTALREDIKTNVTTAQARHRAELIDMMLVRIAAEVEVSSEEHGANCPQGISTADLAALYDKSIDRSRIPELAATIARFAAADRTRRDAVEQRLVEIAGSTAPEGSSGDELNIPNETFSKYLKEKFPDDPVIEVSGVKVIPGGRSKGTMLLDVQDQNGARSIVIRRDFSHMVTGVSVTYEYPVIVALWKAGIQVPEPLWIETDTSVIGGAFIAFSRVPGQAMGTLFQSDAPPAIARAFAATLARVHSIDIKRSSLAGNLNWGEEQHPVRAMVDSFYRRYTEKVAPTPILDTAFAWLYLQMNNIGNERKLVHGDAGLHNVMGEGDQVTGLLDWEFAHAGDPAEDLCYCKGLIESIMPWSEFMEVYRSNGGWKIADIRMQFFTIWRSVMLAIQMGGAHSMYTSGVDRDLRIAAIGFNSFPKILNDLASDLAGFTN